MKYKPLLLLFMVLIVCICLLLFLKKVKKNKIKDISHFSFDYSVGNYSDANVSYSLNCTDICVATIKMEGIKLENASKYKVDLEFVKGLESILKKYDVASWDGFNKSNKNVLDGNSFSLYIKMNSGNSISASGYMKWPNNYKKFKNEVDIYFTKLKN